LPGSASPWRRDRDAGDVADPVLSFSESKSSKDAEHRIERRHGRRACVLDPQDLPESLRRQAQDARRVFSALGCEGISRIDCSSTPTLARYSRDQHPARIAAFISGRRHVRTITSS
jgi:hypothetical protein